MARPRKPIELVRVDGDRKRRGSNKHAAYVSDAHAGQPGRPPDLAEFKPRALPRGATDPAAIALHKLTEARRKRAGEHYEYLLDHLSARGGLLCREDAGAVAGMGWCYALLVEEAENGRTPKFTDALKTYLVGANAFGLSPSARARLPKAKENLSPIDAAMCG